ncbi:MAG: dihydroneopterin aldolase [Gammaproteobacteria bacterium]|jgi:dihydroneopterin aldolase
MDKLYIQSLQLHTTIGCLTWEKQILQTVMVDLEIGIDCTAISKSDDIGSTLNYALLSEQLIAFAHTQKNDLIETLVEKLAQFIHQEYPMIKQLKLSLEKPGAIPNAKTVGITIERIYD